MKRGVIAALLFMALAGSASAQSWPSGPIRWLVGFAAGGTGDMISRDLANDLEKVLGVPIVIENRTGANGLTAAGGKLLSTAGFVLAGAQALYAVTTVAWDWVLQRSELGTTYPLMALAFIVVPIASHIVFGESFSSTTCPSLATARGSIVSSSSAPCSMRRRLRRVAASCWSASCSWKRAGTASFCPSRNAPTSS